MNAMEMKVVFFLNACFFFKKMQQIIRYGAKHYMLSSFFILRLIHTKTPSFVVVIVIFSYNAMIIRQHLDFSSSQKWFKSIPHEIKFVMLHNVENVAKMKKIITACWAVSIYLISATKIKIRKNGLFNYYQQLKCVSLNLLPQSHLSFRRVLYWSDLKLAFLLSPKEGTKSSAV